MVDTHKYFFISGLLYFKHFLHEVIYAKDSFFFSFKLYKTHEPENFGTP